MQTLEHLRQIRPIWTERLSQQLAGGEGVRESFVQELKYFFDFLLQALQYSAPERINPLLEAWSKALTQSDIKDQKSTLSPICNQLFITIYEIAREVLDHHEALTLIFALLPIQAQVYLYSSELEKKREIELIKSELEKIRNQMSQLDKSKSDFISVAAHELKTPLTLIEGYATMLRENIQPLDGNGDILQMLNGMDQGAKRLRRIIDDMIDVSLIDNNLLTLNFQPVWIGRMIRILQGEYDAAIKERGQSLVVRTFEGSEELLFADPERIFQAFANLISNAIKYTPDGGKIIIDGRILPGFLEVTISDTGIGIDLDDQLRIFEKFNRLGDSSRHSSGKIKFKGGGPGLGLPITKGIIEAHGGTLWVESEGYDEVRCPGSTFHVLLPLRKEPPDLTIAKLFRPLIESDQKRNSESQ